MCQKYKAQGRGYGHLPHKQTLVQPWYEIAIDTIGPWTVVINGKLTQLYTVTIIDTMINLTELIRIMSSKAKLTAIALEQGWLHRYPRPVRCIHDQGPEYQGQEFQSRLKKNGIYDVPISVRNPQANAICERIHQVVGNILRTLFNSNPPQNHGKANEILKYALSLA